jgi:hypothetical protein
MSWQRLSIGSRVTREGHARFWERLGVRVPRATRQLREWGRPAERVRKTPIRDSFAAAPKKPALCHGREQAQQGAPTESSLDQVVGTGEQGRRYVKAERSRGLDNTEARCCTSDGRW